MSKLVVFKLGSSTLMDSEGKLDRIFVADLCAQIAELRRRDYRVVLVSSGASAVGRWLLNFEDRPEDIPTLQACAAVGQSKLIEQYGEALAKDGLTCAQVLLTRGDVVDRTGYLNARNTFERLLELGVVPIVNENDTVSMRDFSFGDNDMLGAIVASLIDADQYVILSDIDGLYTANPETHPEAKLIERVEHISSDIVAMAGGSRSTFGTGGMSTKINAARAMIAAGIPMIICKGRSKDALICAVEGKGPHTLFESAGDANHEAARKLWIGLAGLAKGSVVVDDGAAKALEDKGASLLSVGVTEVNGHFSAGDTINVLNLSGELIARGSTRYSSQEIEKTRGLRSEVVARFMPHLADVPVVHRDELLVF